MIKAPWTCYKGRDLYEGDVIIHPSGEYGEIVFLRAFARPHDQWRVNYDNDGWSRLCLQIGDKGMAEKLI